MCAQPAYSGSPEAEPGVDLSSAVHRRLDHYTALKTGQLDIGRVPTADLPQKPLNQTVPSINPLGSGYTLSAQYPLRLYYYVPT